MDIKATLILDQPEVKASVITGQSLAQAGAMTVSVSTDNAAPQDVDTVTLTATGDTGDEYVWTDQDGDLLGYGNPLTTNFSKAGENDVTVRVRRNVDSMSAKATAPALLSCTIKEADDYIARAGITDATEIAAIQQLFSSAKNDAEVSESFLKGHNWPISPTSLDAACKSATTTSETGVYADWTAYNNPMFSQTGIAFNGIDMYLKCLTDFPSHLKPTGRSDIWIIYLRREEGFRTGFQVSGNARWYWILRPGLPSAAWFHYNSQLNYEMTTEEMKGMFTTSQHWNPIDKAGNAKLWRGDTLLTTLAHQAENYMASQNRLLTIGAYQGTVETIAAPVPPLYYEKNEVAYIGWLPHMPDTALQRLRGYIETYQQNVIPGGRHVTY